MRTSRPVTASDMVNRFLIDKSQLPAQFPTHAHAPEFWEHLGRVVGSFGALEEVLGRAIFALTGTPPYSGSDPEAAVAAWSKTLAKALSDTLHPLIDSFGKAVREHPDATIENVDELLSTLRIAARLRNVLCHGSWQMPDAAGRSIPRFATRDLELFDTPVDVAFLEQTQRHVAELVCEVMSVVTHMGYQFPGTDGPGQPVV